MHRTAEAWGEQGEIAPNNSEIWKAYVKDRRMLMRNEIKAWRIANLQAYSAIAAQLRKEAAGHAETARPCLRLAAHFDALSHEMALPPDGETY